MVSDAAYALEVSSLSFRFPGKLALDNVSLHVRTGAFSVLLGANGAGKTTLYSLVTRLYNTNEGDIKILGLDLYRHSSRALKQVGVVFQRPTLDLDLTVSQNLKYHASLHGLGGADADQRIQSSLQRHQLSEFFAKKINQLSGGQRRRVELARALLHQPKLLLLDEATVGLDIQSRKDFISHVRTLCNEEGVGVLWSTHLVDEVQNSDRLIVLDNGKVLKAGVVGEVLAELGVDNVGDAFSALTTKH